MPRKRDELQEGAEALETLVAEGGLADAPTERQGLMKALDIIEGAFALLKSQGAPPPPPPPPADGDEDDEDGDGDEDDEDGAPPAKGKKGSDKEIDIRIAKSEGAGEEDFFERAIAADPELPQVADRTATVERLVDTFAKSEGRYQAIQDRLARYEERQEAVAQGVAALLKGMGAQFGAFEKMASQPVGGTSPGFLMVNPAEAVETAAGEMPVDLQKSLTDALSAGEVSTEYAHFLSKLSVRTPAEVWRMLPPAVRAKLH